MGQVFKALHGRMKWDVALKVLPAEATRDADAVKRFHREVEAAAGLEHPKIVIAHDADEADGVQLGQCATSRSSDARAWDGRPSWRCQTFRAAR